MSFNIPPSLFKHYMDHLQAPDEQKAKLSLLQGMALTQSTDELAKRLLEDEEFKISFYEAIAFPPPYEIQDALASKVVQLLPARNYPDWVKAVLSKLPNSAIATRDKELEFLKNCETGSSFAIPTDIDLAAVRDIDGRTCLHLALLNPSIIPDTLAAIVSACPRLLLLADYNQNYPLELINPKSAAAETIFWSFMRKSASGQFSKLLGLPALVYHLMHMKDISIALKFFSMALEGYQPETIEEVLLLKEPIAECAKNVRREFAKELVVLVAAKLKLPRYAVMLLLNPDMIAEETALPDKQTFPPGTTAEEIINRPLWQSFCLHPLMKGIPQSLYNVDVVNDCGDGDKDSCDPLRFITLFNYRAFLHVNHNQTAYKKLYNEKDRVYLKYTLLFELLFAVPQDNLEAYNFVRDFVRSSLGDDGEDGEMNNWDHFVQCLMDVTIIYRQGISPFPAMAAIVTELILEMCKRAKMFRFLMKPFCQK